MVFIITTPHAICDNSFFKEMNENRDKNLDLHNCDYAAHKIGNMISDKLSYYSMKNFYIKGNKNRRLLDLNRIESRNSNFRKEINSIQRTFKNDTILIDIHSFPDHYIDSAKDSNLFKKNEYPPDIVLLKSKGDNYYGYSLCNEILDSLKNDFIIKIRNNVNVIDIVQQSYENNSSSILIEFNERLVKSNKINFLVESICKKLIEIYLKTN